MIACCSNRLVKVVHTNRADELFMISTSVPGWICAQVASYWGSSHEVTSHFLFLLHCLHMHSLWNKCKEWLTKQYVDPSVGKLLELEIGIIKLEIPMGNSLIPYIWPISTLASVMWHIMLWDSFWVWDDNPTTTWSCALNSNSLMILLGYIDHIWQ